MQIHNLSENNSIFNNFLKEIRDINIQSDRMRFRRNIERIGEIMAYEISKTFSYQKQEVTTPLGKSSVSVPGQQAVIASILRAGLPFHQGFLNYFDHAENSFISAYRKHTDEFTFSIQVDYISCPSLEGKIIILADPMIATGWSIEAVYKRLLDYGQPLHIHIASVIAAQPGIDYLQKVLPEAGITLWTGALDPGLNEKSYIVPGLGDAGDLAYGDKK
jgi:uracil phosphoribosyltransferase